MKNVVIVVETILVLAFLVGFVFLIRENISLREEKATLYDELNELLAEICYEEEGVFYAISFWDPMRGERPLKGVCVKKPGPFGVRLDFHLSTGSVLEIQKVDEEISHYYPAFPEYPSVILERGACYSLKVWEPGGGLIPQAVVCIEDEENQIFLKLPFESTQFD